MNLRLLAPELLLAAGALALLAGESFWPRVKRGWAVLASAALIGAAWLVLGCSSFGAAAGMALVDGLAQYFKAALLAGVLMVVLMSLSYREFLSRDLAWGTYFALLLLSAVGLLLLVSSSDFLMVVVSLELVSVTSFILTGFLREERRSGEAAIKFFLAGAFSAGLMLYGISLYYGVFGTTALGALASANLADVPRLPLVGGLLFILVGFGFKAAMAPFHMWVPDAYEGAPTPITAYLSVAPKAAAFGALVRAFPRHGELHLDVVLAVLAALTMTVGNLAALRQTNVKRLLAYSSIAQMGYVLLGFTAAGRSGLGSVLVYAFAYLFMNLGAFACVVAVTNESRTESLDGFSGLAQRSLPLALASAVFLISLTGLPPLVGFIGKFAVFAAAVEAGWIWLAVVGLVNSVVSLYYYFGVARRMFFSQPVGTGRVALALPLAGCVAVALLVTVGAGLFPDALLTWAWKAVP